MKQKYQERLIALGLVTLLVILLIPLLLIARYNVMGADDFWYYDMAQNGLYEGQSIWGILAAQIRNTFEYWKGWQGPYTSTFFQFTFWSVGGENYYYVTTFITLVPLLLADFFLVYTILKKGFSATLSQIIIASVPIMIYHMSFPPSLVEAYYWFCGAVLYTGFYALSLFSLGFMIRLLDASGKSKAKENIIKAALILFSVCMGGGNFITGLFMVCIYFLFAVYAFWTKHRCRVFYCINFGVMTGCYLLSVFSPGSAVRIETSAEKEISAVKAIMMSFYEAAKYIKTWTFPFVIMLMLAILPLFWKLVKNKNYRFPLPGLVLIMSFCLYAAQFTPNQYALGILGAYRVQNIYRFQMIFWLLGNEFYILGYLHRKFPDLHIPYMKKISKIPLCSLVYGFIATCMILFTMYNNVGPTLSSVSTYKSLRDGSAAVYYQEFGERQAIMNGEGEEGAVVEPFSNPPYALYFN